MSMKERLLDFRNSNMCKYEIGGSRFLVFRCFRSGCPGAGKDRRRINFIQPPMVELRVKAIDSFVCDEHRFSQRLSLCWVEGPSHGVSSVG